MRPASWKRRPALTRIERTPDGDLYASVTLPNLIVGTVGGGTYLPTAQECLGLLGCVGAGKASKFAEICAVVALAGELAIVGAMASGNFASAHAAGGRKALAQRRSGARLMSSNRKPIRRFLMRTVVPPIALRVYRRLGNSWRYTTENEAAC